MSVSIIDSSSRVISISSSDTSGIITIIIVSIVSVIVSVGIPCNSYMYERVCLFVGTSGQRVQQWPAVQGPGCLFWPLLVRKEMATIFSRS